MTGFTYNIEERNEWIERFAEQKERIYADLAEGETVKHCLDAESFGGIFYNPQWVITSEARLWSLGKNRNAGGWNIPYAHERTRRWNMRNDWHETKERLGLTSEKKIYHHQIVANYFCDKKAIELFGEENCVPHHVFRYHHLLDDGIVQDRQEDCTWNNRSKHLRWVTKKDHAVLNYIQDAWNRHNSVDDIIQGMMDGIKCKDEETGEEVSVKFSGTAEELRQQYGEILENGKFYRVLLDASGNPLTDENGDPIKKDQWTALWYEYNGGKDDRRLTVKCFLFDGRLPYIK